MIIETCPVCGHDLISLVLTVNPPIPKKECPNCGWSWIGKQEEVIRVPFGGNSYKSTESLLHTTHTVDGDGLTVLNNTELSQATVSSKDFPSTNTTVNGFINPACERCGNNPANGGSGICFCVLGQPKIT